MPSTPGARDSSGRRTAKPRHRASSLDIDENPVLARIKSDGPSTPSSTKESREREMSMSLPSENSGELEKAQFSTADDGIKVVDETG